MIFPISKLCRPVGQPEFLASCKSMPKVMGFTCSLAGWWPTATFASLFDDKGKIIGGQRAVSLNLSYRGRLAAPPT